MGGGRTMCQVGSLYCRGETWSNCENIAAFEIEHDPTAALVAPPTECNPCNPDCFVGRDYPDDTELTPANSTRVEYDPVIGGVVLESCSSVPPPIVSYTFDGGDSAASITDRAAGVPIVGLRNDPGRAAGTATFGTDASGGYVALAGGRLQTTAATPTGTPTADTMSDALRNALIASNAFTVEAWLTTANNTQAGPRRIATLSTSDTARAFTLGQEGASLVARLRYSTSGDLDGTTPTLTAPGVFPTGATPIHVIMTWDGTTGIHSLYVDGALVASATHPSADLSNWSASQFFFGLGDEFGAARSWAGNLYHVAVYSVAMSPTDVACLDQRGSNPDFTDSDADGVPDVADACVGPGWLAPCDGDPSNDGIVHILPYGGTGALSTLQVNTRIQTADVYVLMDASGSMSGEIGNLKSGLTTGTYDASCPAGVNGGVLGAIQCTIPDAQFGLGFFVEYPDGVHGDANSVPYRHLVDITGSTAAMTQGVNTLRTDSNIDTPESQNQALYAAATGNGLGPWVPNRRACPGLGWGYPCFRDGTIPIILMFTDAPFHNGVNAAYDYTTSQPSFTMPEAFPVLGNDTFAGAYDLGNLTGTSVHVVGATFGMGDNIGNAGCGANTLDVAFRFNVTAVQTTYISTRVSDFDTTAAFWDNNVTPNHQQCDDNRTVTPDVWGRPSPFDRTSHLSRSLSAGTYHAVIDGHGGGNGSYMAMIGTGTGGTATTAIPVTSTDATDALNAGSIRLITVVSDNGDSTYAEAIADSNAVGLDTGSVDDSGNPYVYTIAADGTGLSTAVVNGVFDLANYTRFDTELIAEDNLATGAVDERGFVVSVTVTDCPAARCDPGLSGSMCLGCLPATDVGFEATFRNDIVMPTAVPQVFTFDMVLLANGTYELDRVPVTIIVPPITPVYLTPGSYTQVYDGTTFCDVPVTRPDWSDFTWTIDTPSDSYVTFTFRTAPTQPELGTANPVSFTDPTSVPLGAPPLDAGDFLILNGESNYLPYLEVTATLHPSTDNLSSPVLYGFEQSFTCTPAE